MKTISVSENLHKWIMDHKNSERTSAEKVVYGLIGEVDCLKKKHKMVDIEIEFPTDDAKEEVTKYLDYISKEAGVNRSRILITMMYMNEIQKAINKYYLEGGVAPTIFTHETEYRPK